ncbi:putative multiple sugar transport system substrate-binding protein [Diaminobutyricimonas aerilata]|uniref:Putative multiple sugar transport system substrate-binding protein n=1 Tax=Diaminobutyricimonas aerilata TaxID=1162967 RepID=A0A2M9CGR7_9MICO|nr:sugar-binding protein [Diaminobutyricimonas aerilata]PJJ71062.1 putative multiple sugar transport system substrate-binding protein [Diaminobutyricimonas aerilata]
MRKIALATVAVAATAALALGGCSSRTDEGTSGGTEEGFAADSSIGVALPDKTSENWVLAGDLFTEGLEEAGFKADVQYAPANNTVPEQQNQISSMVTNGAKVIIIGAKDSAQLSAQVEQAKQSGAVVIAYDRLITNTEAVDYYLAFDNFKVGQLQGQALLDGLAEKYPDADTYNIELFAGSPDDNNAKVFFDGAMEVLQPKIDDGTLNVVSGQTGFEQVVTQGWLAQNAQSRMDTVLAGNYTGTELHGVLSPNDTLARAIIESTRAAGKPLPVVTGQDSEVESVKSIVAGEQYMTIYKDTRALVQAAIDMVKTLQAGDEPEVNDTETYDNGVKVVPSFLLDPVVVTKENAADAYADNDTLSALTK